MVKKQSVFIIGAGGMVGAAAAQALALKETVDEIVLIDIAGDLVSGQAMDINHATAFTRGVHVRVGDYSEIADNDIVIVTCGIAQKPGQTRLELLGINAKIIQDVTRNIMTHANQPYIVLVTNPVDVLTKVALETSGLPKERVLGTGTTLDTARFKVVLANKLGVSQQEVVGYILGEHGDSSFPALSSVMVGGVPLSQFDGYQVHMTHTIEREIRDAAYKIIESKKSTYFGIGSAIVRIVEALRSDAASILPVCSLATHEYGLQDVVLGLPSLVSSEGVEILDNYPLSKEEMGKLHHSAGVVKAAFEQVKL